MPGNRMPAGRHGPEGPGTGAAGAPAGGNGPPGPRPYRQERPVSRDGGERTDDDAARPPAMPVALSFGMAPPAATARCSRAVAGTGRTEGRHHSWDAPDDPLSRSGRTQGPAWGCRRPAARQARPAAAVRGGGGGRRVPGPSPSVRGSYASGRRRRARRVWRVRVLLFLTAMCRARLSPTSTTSFLPRVTPV